MIMNLLIGLRLEVIPILSPVVLYAETLSKAISIIVRSGSKADIPNTPMAITIIDREIIANALFTVTSTISRRYNSIRSRPLAKLKMFKMAIASVVVLIPPPVDFGEAPTHIKNIVSNKVGNLK